MLGMHPYAQGLHDKIFRNETIKLLKQALADELIAGHQYWMQAKLIEGFNKEEAVKELLQHREEEWDHADLIMNRIMELGGNPEIRPLDWDRYTKCRYTPTIDRDQVSILEDSIASEKCAIEHYNQILEFTKDRDITTNQLIHRIINDEFEHIRDLNKVKKAVEDQLPEKKIDMDEIDAKIAEEDQNAGTSE
jgi:bacterioferritin